MCIRDSRWWIGGGARAAAGRRLRGVSGSRRGVGPRGPLGVQCRLMCPLDLEGRLPQPGELAQQHLALGRDAGHLGLGGCLQPFGPLECLLGRRRRLSGLVGGLLRQLGQCPSDQLCCLETLDRLLGALADLVDRRAPGCLLYTSDAADE